MRYVIFSDIHGNGLSFDSFITEIVNIKYDQLVFLGDFVGYYYDSERIIRFCSENGVLCLLGNHDSYFLDMLDGRLGMNQLVSRYGHSYAHAKETILADSVDFLKSLQSRHIIAEPKMRRVLLCHGSPLDPLEGRIYPDTDILPFGNTVSAFDYVICGHTHHKMTRFLGDTVFLNPGSLGQQRDGRGCSYLILDTLAGEHSFHTVDYDIEMLERQIDRFDAGNDRLKQVLRRRG